MLAILGDHLFVLSLMQNLAGREGDFALPEEDLVRLAQQHAALVDEWLNQFPDKEPTKVLVKVQNMLDAELGVRHDPGPMIDRIGVRLLNGLAAVTDRRRIVGLVTRRLSNAVFLLLDLPLTRLMAKEFAIRTKLPFGSWFEDWDLSDADAVNRFISVLRQGVDTADECGLPALQELIESVANAIAGLDLAALNGDEGHFSTHIASVAGARCGLPSKG